MLNPLLRLRSCRILALLAALLLAGVPPHGHGAAGAWPAAAASVTADHGDAPEQGAALADCGLCHASRAMMPHRAGTLGPQALPGTVLALALVASPEGQPGRVPARPPRQPTPA